MNAKSLKSKSQIATTDGPKVTSFRLKPNDRKALADLAAKQSLNSHQMAHNLVIDALRNVKGQSRLAEEIEDLKILLKMLRDDLGLSVEVLLQAAGKIQKEDAGKWVDTNLSRG